MKKILLQIGIFYDTFKEVFRTLKQEYLSSTYLLVLFLFTLALIFGFLTLFPVLSSFLYPLV